MFVLVLFLFFFFPTDNFLYSLSYHHFGAPKTWYGVPGSEANVLEKCLKRNYPELFEEEPDLIFKLVTMISPELLLVNIYIYFYCNCCKDIYTGMYTGANKCSSSRMCTPVFVFIFCGKLYISLYFFNCSVLSGRRSFSMSCDSQTW